MHLCRRQTCSAGTAASRRTLLQPVPARPRLCLGTAAAADGGCSPCTSEPQQQGDAGGTTTATRRGLGAVIAAAAGALAAPRRVAAGLDDYNTTADPIQEATVQLGDEGGALVFSPSMLEFTAGRVYKLRLSNPSEFTHYFTALEFASKTYTILVLANGVEVKGAVSEVALKKGAEALWIFVPLKPGRFPLRCTVKGHTEGGMVGEIVVRPAPGSSAKGPAA